MTEPSSVPRGLACRCFMRSADGSEGCDSWKCRTVPVWICQINIVRVGVRDWSPSEPWSLKPRPTKPRKTTLRS